MSTSVKAILFGFPLAILLQFIVVFIVRTTYEAEPDARLLGTIGFLNGMVAFFIIKKHLVKKESKQDRTK